MVSYLGSLVQFSPAAGRAGRCRQILLCVGSTPHVPATLGLPRSRVSVLSLSTLLRLLAALHGAGPALSGVPVFGYSTKARIRLCLRVVSSPASAVQAARGSGALSPGAARLFPPRHGLLRKSSDRNWGLFAGWERVASLGLSLPLAPPPASYLQRGWAGSSLGSQSLCFVNRRRCVPDG